MSGVLRIGEVAKAVGVSVDTLRRWESEGKVTFQRQGNARVLPIEDLPVLLKGVGGDGTSSARNHLSGTVVKVTRDKVMAQVEMVCGDFRVVSLMSREAADELDLQPGMNATAVVKATNVSVQV